MGGLKKKGDNLNLSKIKDNVSKAFIIGKDRSFFRNSINNKISFKETINLKNTMKFIFNELKTVRKNNIKTFVILSPASASYDQFENFEQRGNLFKKLINLNAKKYL